MGAFPVRANERHKDAPAADGRSVALVLTPEGIGIVLISSEPEKRSGCKIEDYDAKVKREKRKDSMLKSKMK